MGMTCSARMLFVIVFVVVVFVVFVVVFVVFVVVVVTMDCTPLKENTNHFRKSSWLSFPSNEVKDLARGMNENFGTASAIFKQSVFLRVKGRYSW